MQTKRCSRCKQEKPLDSFHKWKDGKYGRNHRCIECCSSPSGDGQRRLSYDASCGEAQLVARMREVIDGQFLGDAQAFAHAVGLDAHEIEELYTGKQRAIRAFTIRGLDGKGGLCLALARATGDAACLYMQERFPCRTCLNDLPFDKMDKTSSKPFGVLNICLGCRSAREKANNERKLRDAGLAILSPIEQASPTESAPDGFTVIPEGRSAHMRPESPGKVLGDVIEYFKWYRVHRTTERLWHVVRADVEPAFTADEKFVYARRFDLMRAITEAVHYHQYVGGRDYAEQLVIRCEATFKVRYGRPRPEPISESEHGRDDS